jgi:hypothetical protein
MAALCGKLLFCVPIDTHEWFLCMYLWRNLIRYGIIRSGVIIPSMSLEPLYIFSIFTISKFVLSGNVWCGIRLFRGCQKPRWILLGYSEP